VKILYYPAYKKKIFTGAERKHETINSLLLYARGQGHNIYLQDNRQAGDYTEAKDLGFPEYDGEDIDFNFMYWGTRGYGVCARYEGGPLFRSIYIEPSEQRGPIFYREDMSQELANYKPTEAVSDYIRRVTSNNLSKRKQPPRRDLSEYGEFIFLPIQNDSDYMISINSFWTFKGFMECIAEFAASYGLKVLFKLHPHHLSGRGPSTDVFNQIKEKYPEMDLVDASIFDLCQQARFTMTVNSGSMVDNFMLNTPVMCFGECQWDKTDAVIRSPDGMDMQESFRIMMEEDYDKEKMYKAQRLAVEWLYYNLIMNGNSPEENWRRLMKHLKNSYGFDS
jgi:hypothetical protein